MNDRLIEFRAWDKFEKKMISWDECLKNEALIPEILLNAVRYEPMQCTGLKDKNGRLIYSGDIVLWNDGGGECELKPKKGWIRIAEVKLFPDLHFKIIGCYPKRTCEIGHEFHFGNFIYKETEKHLKIIANIHENADLLEDK